MIILSPLHIFSISYIRHRISLLLMVCLCFSTSAIANIISKASLDDKIGQMLLIGFDGKTIDAHSEIVQSIIKNNLGGVILFDYDYHKKTYDRNIESLKQVKQLTHDLQYFNHQGQLKHHRRLQPLLIAVDYEGGNVARLQQKYGFLATLSAAKIGKLGLTHAKINAHAMANTLKETGFNLNFAPVLDVNVNLKNPIIGTKERSFSSDANTVARYASAYSHQFLSQSIQCAYKHFPGHGSANDDSHLGFVDVTKTWKPYELTPYKQLLNKPDACGMIMTAHIINRQLDASGLPATLSHTILTKILRHQLHFKGVIITDDMQMKAISDHYGVEQAMVLAINAGADMMIFGNNLPAKSYSPKQLINIIKANVLSGKISLKRINEAYQKINTLKNSLHLTKVRLDN